MINMGYLQKGSKGVEVMLLQIELVALGYDIGEKWIDGKFGKDTDRAVRQFQKDHGLIEDGKVWPPTEQWDENPQKQTAVAINVALFKTIAAGLIDTLTDIYQEVEEGFKQGAEWVKENRRWLDLLADAFSLLLELLPQGRAYKWTIRLINWIRFALKAAELPKADDEQSRRTERIQQSLFALMLADLQEVLAILERRKQILASMRQLVDEQYSAFTEAQREQTEQEYAQLMETITTIERKREYLAS